MLMTEEQARTKWCPHYRQYASADETGDNRPGGGFNPLCIASDCMAWRSEPRLVNPGKVDAHWTEVGFCGAFGKPGV